MPFDLGAGLASMGGSIAETAGRGALEIQRADLDRQRILLADELQGKREVNMENMRQAGAEKLVGLQGDSQIKVNKANIGEQILAHGKELEQDTKAAVAKVKALATPDLLAAQRAITAASALPNNQLQVKDDGTAVSFNPLTNKITPIMDPGTHQPIKFQNPETSRAVMAQTMSLRDIGSNLDRNYKAALDTAKVLSKDDGEEEQKKAISEVDKYYRPKLEEVNRQLMSLTTALGIKSGVDLANEAPKNAPPLSSFLTQKPVPKSAALAPTNSISPSLLNGVK